MSRKFDDMLRRRINASPVKAEVQKAALDLGFPRGGLFATLENRHRSENPDQEIPQEARIAVNTLELDSTLAIQTVIDAAMQSSPLTFAAMWKLITEALEKARSA